MTAVRTRRVRAAMSATSVAIRATRTFVARRAISALAPLVALGTLLTPSAAPADSLTPATAKALFNARGCNACHAVDEHRIAPSYRSIALRYAAESADVAPRLALKIRVGGAGAWGSVPMVANPRVTPAEADAIARWVLALATPEGAADPSKAAAP